MNTKRAFTLIELLVVIAIIAILAAILFPVFAQAKEAAKKTATLTHFKEFGVAMIIYTADNDDRFPKAHSPDTSTGGERWNFNTSVPAGWRQNGVHDINPRMTEDGMHWGNSTHPYTKNYDIMAQNGIPESILVSDLQNTRPANVGLSYNGLLNTYSATAINRPSELSILWAGRGKQNVQGFALSTPTLRCNGTGPCSFQPSGPPQSDSSCAGGGNCSAMFTTDSLWVYGKGMHFVATDSSAKYRNLDGPDDLSLITRYNDHPAARMNPGGSLASYWVCNDGSGFLYACMFRPDFEFNL